MNFLSIDPSIRNTGICAGRLLDTGVLDITHADLFTTEKTDKKVVRASSDLIDRVANIKGFLEQCVKQFNPKVIFVETPSGSQSADGMKNYGAVCAIIAHLNPRPIEVNPQEVKLATVGTKTASKADMIEWAHHRHPDLAWLTRGGRLIAANEHIADAVAVAYAGVRTTQFQQLKALLK